MGTCGGKAQGGTYRIAAAMEGDRRFSGDDRRFDWLARGPSNRRYDTSVPKAPDGGARGSFESCFPGGHAPSLGPVLGKGAFGQVHLGSTTDGQHYAIKVMGKRHIAQSGEDEKARVISEVGVLRKLCHPFIVHFFTAYQDKAAVYIVMQYAVGGELFNRLREQERFTEDVAKFYTAQIASALAYLHQSRIVYRDLKPENIMLDEHGNVQLVDFGFAVVLPPEGFLTDVVGTTMYMAPELALGPGAGRKYGLAVDYWALGCVTYEMLTGEAPFGDQGDESKIIILQKIEAGKVIYPTSFSKAITDLLKGLLQPQADRRFAFSQVEGSEWFQGLNWVSLLNCAIRPPWEPKAEGPGGRHNFIDWSAKAETKNGTMDEVGLNMPGIPWGGSNASPRTPMPTAAGGKNHVLTLNRLQSQASAKKIYGSPPVSKMARSASDARLAGSLGLNQDLQSASLTAPGRAQTTGGTPQNSYGVASKSPARGSVSPRKEKESPRREVANSLERQARPKLKMSPSAAKLKKGVQVVNAAEYLDTRARGRAVR